VRARISTTESEKTSKSVPRIYSDGLTEESKTSGFSLAGRFFGIPIFLYISS